MRSASVIGTWNVNITETLGYDFQYSMKTTL